MRAESHCPSIECAPFRMAFCTLKALAHRFGNVAEFPGDKVSYLALDTAHLKEKEEN